MNHTLPRERPSSLLRLTHSRFGNKEWKKLSGIGDKLVGGVRGEKQERSILGDSNSLGGRPWRGAGF